MKKEGVVTSLFYRLYRLDCTTPFSDPDPILGESEAGSFRLDNEVLTISLATECNSIAQAREVVKPLIEAWQLEAEIQRHPTCSFRFAFWKAETNGSVIDHAKHSPEPLEYEKDDKGPLVFYSRVYPPAPSTRFTSEMKAVWSRYWHSTIGIGEPVQSAAYYALTIAERTAGGRRNAASTYQIAEAVLRKVGELTSIRGSADTARKAIRPKAKPLTRREIHWIDNAIRLLFLHLGKVEAGGLPDRLTMVGLPNLETQ